LHDLPAAAYRDAATSEPAANNHIFVSHSQWESTLKALVGAGKTELFELGPGAQIKSMLKRIDNSVWKATKTVAA
jgi:malonyl CoA-acyl carrier protein transacylase